MRSLLIVFLLFQAALAVLGRDPTLYEYYTSGGIHSGLVANHSDYFTLNGKPFVIYGGSLHYFRIVPQYWRQTLARYRAAGLNTIQFYLPWALIEDIPGTYDFTSPSLNLATFLEEINAADMFAIIRPGPYICAEFEFGGFPSWLLRDAQMRLRSDYTPYLVKVKRYWEQVMKIINRYQFSTTGGPIIMLQIENEYFGAFWMQHSAEYLRFLLNITREGGFKELVFTSDPGFAARQLPTKDIFNSTEEVLETANFNEDSLEILTALKAKQPGKPGMVSEFWPGWYDTWNDTAHHRYSVEKFEKEVSDVLFKANSSISFYMFQGGTNFGFLNGARVVTSYDYNAPLTESGNLTDKYHKTRELYQKLVTSGRLPKLHLPEIPPIQRVVGYGTTPIETMLPLEAMLTHAQNFTNLKNPIPMELLHLGKDHGQRFGFILYRVIGKQVAAYEVTGPIADQATFMVNGDLFKKVDTTEDGTSFLVQVVTYPIRLEEAWYKYDLLVENMGRYHDSDTMDSQRKGIQAGAQIKLDGTAIHNITVYSLDFPVTFMNQIQKDTNWINFTTPSADDVIFPALYRTTLKISGQPADTFILLTGWTKGNVFVNGFNLGRYWSVGPQRTLYLPAPLLKTGDNRIEVFELHRPGKEVAFVEKPILG